MPDLDWGALIWAFINSNVGLALVGGLLVFLLGRFFKARPEWETLFHKYRPAFFDAVRQAENAISPTTATPALAKSKAALQYLLNLAPHLGERVKEEDLIRGLTEAHDILKDNEFDQRE
jgi:hypothetical protein